ncbi:PqiC family protein [Sphaerotilus uruguayifluvii]|uniref:ABC-type transport auxiliary lipoprotein component domain-containing protein n=1 Tax=Sphaerotilus uruguayifluvii TaxID=2735897 RepID=A0ABX2FX82_9BURK|nr:ABC-type transport auxiliary lipoprotein family protein [Leptothrix sp. C29]NRT54633.1 hypothetical protein [Leptothrix sp. C29]
MKSVTMTTAPARRLLLRRGAGVLAGALAATVLAGCAAAPTRVPRLLRLAGSDDAAAAGEAAPDLSAAPVWQLQRVQLPAYLDRELILAGQGAHGLQALPDVRWAEPLGEAVPRLLRADLAAAAAAAGLPVQVWGAALPAGLVAVQRLRIDIDRLEADRPGGVVRLGASWVATDPAGRRPPRAGRIDLAEPVDAPGPDGAAPEAERLVAAHRRALRRLAQAVAPAVVRVAQGARETDSAFQGS